MTSPRRGLTDGFTLIELLTALLILTLMALMSYRGLGAVLDAHERVTAETDKWRQLAAFFSRFERDVHLASPRPVRSLSGSAPAWRGAFETSSEAALEFSRFAADEDSGIPQRLAYRLNQKQEIELWLWPGPDLTPDAQPARYAVLGGVTKLEFAYLNVDLAWVDAWPGSPRDAAIPRAVRLKVVRTDGGEIVRVFALNS